MVNCAQPISPRERSARGRAGFTLVELLLTVTLLLLLITAFVVNFSPIRRGASLDEGVSRLESLIRFSRAEAANRGRTVRLEFQPGSTNAPDASAESVRLCWEPDPLGAPGAFEELPRALWDSDLDDCVDIVSVRPMTGQSSPAPESALAPENAPPPARKDKTASAEAKTPTAPARSQSPCVISFYPDGSSDSAELIVNSKEDDDSREVAIRLMGTTGWIYHQPVTNEVQAADSDVSGKELAEDPF